MNIFIDILVTENSFKGIILNENKDFSIFTDKKKMWEHLLNLCSFYCKINNEDVNIYMLNMKNRYYSFFDIKNNEIVYKSSKPFLAQINYSVTKRALFLGIESIYDENIKKIKSITGYEDNSKIVSVFGLVEDKDIIVLYNNVCALNRFIQYIKGKNKEANMKTRNIITIGQIAMTRFLNKVKKDSGNLVLSKSYIPRIIQTPNKVEIKKACRGGRNQAFYSALEVEKATYIDINSLYPFSAVNIPFPDLKSEKIYYYPDKSRFMENIDKMGVSKVLLYKDNNKDNIGIVPITFKSENETEIVFPTHRDIYVCGVYTNMEIKEFVKVGWKVLKVEYIICFDTLKESPLKSYFEELYRLRKESNNKFDNWYYKSLMNHLIGKFNQTYKYKNFVIDDMMKSEEYEEEGFKVNNWFPEEELAVYRNEEKFTYARWFCPLIYSYITAYARLKLYNEMCKIDKEDLLYCDTDSIMFKGNYLSRFEIGEGLGKFKIVECDERAKIWGKKIYTIGKNIKMSGMMKELKESMDEEVKTKIMKDFGEGRAIRKWVTGIKGARNISEIGGFKETETDIIKSVIKKMDFNETILETQVFVDEAIKGGELWLLKDIDVIIERGVKDVML